MPKIARDRDAFFKVINLGMDTNSVHQVAAWKIGAQLLASLDLEKSLYQAVGFAFNPWNGSTKTIQNGTMKDYAKRSSQLHEMGD